MVENTFETQELYDTMEKKIGAILCQVRQSKSIDLKTVSEILRIKINHLEAIEESRLEDYPKFIYAVGFVRSYAAFLGLNAEDIVERFKQENNHHVEKKQYEYESITHQQEFPKKITLFWSFLAIISIYYGWHWYNSPNEKPELINESSQNIVLNPAQTQNSSSITEGKDKLNSINEAPHSESVTEKSTISSPFGEEKNDKGQSSTTTMTEVSSSSQPSSLSTNLASSDQTMVNTQNDQPVNDQKSSHLILRADADCLMTLRDRNGNLVVHLQMQKGQTYVPPVWSGLKLSASDAGALLFIVDGKALKHFGKIGETKNNIPLDFQLIQKGLVSKKSAASEIIPSEAHENQNTNKE